MDWQAIRVGFEDEFMKIAEMSLAGLSSETLMSYPKPEPMPSAAYEKAQQIIAKMQPKEMEKEADSVRPDQMPQLKKLFRKRRKEEDPPPSVIDRVLSHGGHTLAGAGAAKFSGDAVEKIREGLFNKGPFSHRTKALILAGGATAGLANKVRKDRRRKKWNERHAT